MCVHVCYGDPVILQDLRMDVVSVCASNSM